MASSTDFGLKFHGAEVSKANSIEEKYFILVREYLYAKSPSTGTGEDRFAEQVDHLTRPSEEPGTNTEEAAQNDGNKSVEENLWSFWAVFIHIATQIPCDNALQIKLIDLLRALKELPPTTVNIWGNETQVWTDLPLLGPSIREHWNVPHPGNSPSQDQLKGWINLNAFLARLMESQVSSAPDVQLPIWALRSALEEKPPAQAAVFESRIGAAAQWIIHAGQVLAANMKDSAAGQDEGFAQRTEPGPLYLEHEGQSGLNPHRWSFWKSRFLEVAASVESQETSSLAKEAANVMETLVR